MVIQLPVRAKRLLVAAGAACSIIGGTVLIKDAVGGDKYEKIGEEESKKKLVDSIKNKVFIVTGANTGIGKEITWELARLNARVYMACRDMKKCEETRKEIVLDTRNKYVYCRPCDLASQKSIREFVASFNEEKCDGLINNAGVMNHKRMFTEDGIELHLAVNHIGPFLLTSLLLDNLKAAEDSRIVYLMNLDFRKGQLNFDDLNSQKSYDKTAAFAQSQLANMIMVKYLADKLKDSGVSVNAAYPGVVQTGIKRHMGVDSSILGNIVANPLLWFLTRKPEQGAQTPLFVAIDDQVADKSGKLFSNLKELKVDHDAVEDKEVQERLFMIDQYWSGLKTKEELATKVAQK